MSNHAHEARPTSIKTLSIRNFRKFQEKTFTFDEPVNVFWGNNAQGKTTILEAIYLLTLGRSFRTSRLSELVRHGEDAFQISITFETLGIEQKISIAASGREKKVAINDIPSKSLSSLIGLIPTVIITPDDDLLKGPPHSRRKFLDAEISQFDALYLHHLARYYKAMRQRNELLKSKQVSLLLPWEMEMAASGAYINSKRVECVKELNEKATPLYHKLSGTEDPFQLELEDKPTSREEFLQKYQDLREKEVRFGSTLFGPHRDDLNILIQEKGARHFASEGQKRSAIAAMRLASWELLRDHTGTIPLMLIDDFGISLDKSRRAHFEQTLPEMGQVFVTSVEELKLSNTPFYIEQSL